MKIDILFLQPVVTPFLITMNCSIQVELAYELTFRILAQNFRLDQYLAYKSTPKT